MSSMTLYKFIQYHISTLETVPQCLSIAQWIAYRNAQLTVQEITLLLQSLKLKEDEICMLDQKMAGLNLYGKGIFYSKPNDNRP